MAEQLLLGLTETDNEIARDLYSNQHRRHADSLAAAEDTIARAEEARRMVAEADARGAIDDVPYETRVFAIGERIQRDMHETARLHYDANQWRARQHKEQHLTEYIGQAVIEAGDAGVVIDLMPGTPIGQ